MAKQTPKPIRKTVSFKYRNFNCYEHIKDIDNFSSEIKMFHVKHWKA
jgi:hypothetical protein